MFNGLVHQGISPQVATRVANLPPVSTLFAALLGYNPVAHLLGPSVLAHLTAGQRAHSRSTALGHDVDDALSSTTVP